MVIGKVAKPQDVREDVREDEFRSIEFRRSIEPQAPRRSIEFRSILDVREDSLLNPQKIQVRSF